MSLSCLAPHEVAHIESSVLPDLDLTQTWPCTKYSWKLNNEMKLQFLRNVEGKMLWDKWIESY